MKISSDSLIHLLLILPTKSLLRFKSICKSWHALIESQHFISKHFDSKRCNVLVNWLALTQPAETVETTSFQLFTDDALERSEKPRHLQLPQIASATRVKYLLGPYKGVFCIATEYDEKIVLWNPATKTIRLLPHHPLIWTRDGNYRNDGNQYEWQIGFGEDVISNNDAIKFKIVSLIGIGPKYERKLMPRFAIYTSEYDSWRIVKDNSVVGYYRGGTTSHWARIFVNGFYYWKPHHTADEKYVILAFDMHREIFSKIEIPESIRDGLAAEITSCNDSLALFTYQRLQGNAYFIDLWQFEEKNKCWTKLSSSVLPFAAYCTFGYWKDYKIFVVNKDISHFIPNGSLHLFDMDSGNILRTLRSQEETFVGLGVVYLYKESLVPIKVGQETDFDSFLTFDRSRIRSKREYNSAIKKCQVKEERQLDHSDHN